jgi:hypothetical protein
MPRMIPATKVWTKLIPMVLAAIGFALIAMPVMAQAPWPGQSGNAVGYAAAPGWPGSFTSTACPSSTASGTSWANATIVTNCTYSSTQMITCNYCEFLYVDFNVASGGVEVASSASHVLFLGDRFQSNDVGSTNVGVLGTYIYFFYDSTTPMASLYTSPPGSLWPSAGAGANSTTIIPGTNAIPYADSYEYGFNIGGSGSPGPIWIDHCDIWGFGDAIVNQTTTNQMTITANWMHDPSDNGSNAYHTDGFGYSNEGMAPSNVLLVGNTTGMLGNTQGLALQGATGGYQNIYVAENYFSGDGATIAWCMPGIVQCTNSYFYGNTFGTDVAPGGPVYGYTGLLGAGSVWACNTISVRPGTTWKDGNDSWAPTSAMNGQFFTWASGTAPNLSYNSTTDEGGNTHCGIPSPATINFGTQGTGSSSAGKTITFSNTNTASLSISSIALATGTQFSISSNTCGSTLAASSTCSITITFTPTSLGPETDTLKITDNTNGVSSPQLVPLAGIGTASSGDPAPNPPVGLSAVIQ